MSNLKYFFAISVIVFSGSLENLKAFPQDLTTNQDPYGSGRGIQREDGSERGNCPTISVANKKLTALIHKESSALTTYDAPTILVYNPYASSEPLQGILRLQERSPRKTYRETIFPQYKYTNVVPPLTITLPKLAGIVALKFPKIPKKNSLYYWSLTIECKQDKFSASSGDSSDNPGVHGKIEWREPSPNLLNLLRKDISITERSAIYSKEKFWLDSLSVIFESPDITTNNKEWDRLLSELDLQSFSIEKRVP
jgi:hypothetical protein